MAIERRRQQEARGVRGAARAAAIARTQRGLGLTANQAARLRGNARRGPNAGSVDI